MAYFSAQEASELTRRRAWLWHGENDEPPTTVVTETGKLARCAPGDLLVVATYGHALEKARRHREAMDVYRHAYELGAGALPETFAGKIDRESDTAIGLLDAAAGLGRCECASGSLERGIDVLEWLSTWDDDPRNEAWLHLGSLYVARGRTERWPAT